MEKFASFAGLAGRQRVKSENTGCSGSLSLSRLQLAKHNVGRVIFAHEVDEIVLELSGMRMRQHVGEEGICNHFSAVVPGHSDLCLVNPYGWAFAEITASQLLICDYDGNVNAGEGKPEATAFYIHTQLHKAFPRATAAFHTHMPNATALSMLEGQPFIWAGQTSLKFYGRTAVEENYNGLALDNVEGERIASTIGDADIVFMKNHGVMVLGPTIAEAFDDLYYLERAAEVQVKAMATGRPLKPIPHEIAQKAYLEMREGDAESARLHLESVRRQLMKSEPEFAD